MENELFLHEGKQIYNNIYKIIQNLKFHWPDQDNIE